MLLLDCVCRLSTEKCVLSLTSQRHRNLRNRTSRPKKFASLDCPPHGSYDGHPRWTLRPRLRRQQGCSSVFGPHAISLQFLVQRRMARAHLAVPCGNHASAYSCSKSPSSTEAPLTLSPPMDYPRHQIGYSTSLSFVLIWPPAKSELTDV